MNQKITVVISAFKEENNLKDCLESLKWADEIIVIDNSSTDKTAQIAKKYTPFVFKRPNYPMLNINKNFGFSKAGNDWILNLDADERVSAELQKEIIAAIKLTDAGEGFEIPRKNIIFGKWIQHGIWWPDYQLRLFKNGSGKFPCIHVHEKIDVTGKISQLTNPIIHHNYTSISQYLYKFEHIYTENEVDVFLKSGKKIYWYDAVRMPVNEFLSNFLARSIYKDGLHGLVLSILQSFYAFVVFAKIWEKQKFWEYNNKNFLSEVNLEVRNGYGNYKFWTKNAIFKNIVKKIVGESVWVKLRSLKKACK